MEKLAMCRICLVQNVRMYVVFNKNLHELYEKLTDVPFVTKDSRPMLACFFCCTKLNQCYEFLRKCLEAEKLFAQMLNKPGHLINPGRFEFFNGFSNSPVELISIDGGQTERDTIKEELAEVSERPDDIIDPEEEHPTDKSEFDNADNSYPDVEDTPGLHAESDTLDVIPFMEIKIEVEGEQESIGAPVVKMPQLDTRRPNPRETISAEQKKNENNRNMSCVSKIIIEETQNLTSKRITKFKEPLTKTQHGVNSRVNNTALGTSSRNNSDTEDIKSKIPKNGVDSDDINRYQRVPEKCFKCDVCQRSFYKNSDLTRHIRTHTGEKPFKCDVCQKSFKLKYHLTIHTRIHTGEKPYKCEICQRNFRHKNYLTSHTRTHTGEKPFKCHVCQSSFNQKIHLTTHIRTHTGEKPYKCDICQRSFIKKSDLTSHTRTHTGEKPFKCVICQHSFTKKRSLISHICTDTSEEPFKCVICQLSFHLKQNLTRHIRTHTSEIPFKCV